MKKRWGILLAAGLLLLSAPAVGGTELVPLPQPGSGMTPTGNRYHPDPPSRLVFVHPGGGN